MWIDDMYSSTEKANLAEKNDKKKMTLETVKKETKDELNGLKEQVEFDQKKEQINILAWMNPEKKDKLVNEISDFKLDFEGNKSLKNKWLSDFKFLGSFVPTSIDIDSCKFVDWSSVMSVQLNDVWFNQEWNNLFITPDDVATFWILNDEGALKNDRFQKLLIAKLDTTRENKKIIEGVENACDKWFWLADFWIQKKEKLYMKWDNTISHNEIYWWLWEFNTWEYLASDNFVEGSTRHNIWINWLKLLPNWDLYAEFDDKFFNDDCNSMIFCTKKLKKSDWSFDKEEFVAQLKQNVKDSISKHSWKMNIDLKVRPIDIPDNAPNCNIQKLLCMTQKQKLDLENDLSKFDYGMLTECIGNCKNVKLYDIATRSQQEALLNESDIITSVSFCNTNNETDINWFWLKIELNNSAYDEPWNTFYLTAEESGWLLSNKLTLDQNKLPYILKEKVWAANERKNVLERMWEIELNMKNIWIKFDEWKYSLAWYENLSHEDIKSWLDNFITFWNFDENNKITCNCIESDKYWNISFDFDDNWLNESWNHVVLNSSQAHKLWNNGKLDYNNYFDIMRESIALAINAKKAKNKDV